MDAGPWLVGATTLAVLAVLTTAVIGVQRRRRRRALEAVRAAEEAAAGQPPGITSLVGGLLKTSVGVVADLLLTDEVHRLARDGEVTIMFADLAGSTALNLELGDEAFADLIAEHDRITGEVVAGAGGDVVKRQGDGFMALLPSPAAAVEAARGVREAVRDNPEIGRPLRVRVGLHTATVVGRGGDYFGEGVAMAARVADAADGDDVLLTEAVADGLDDAEELRPLRPRRLDGLPGRHRLYRLPG